MSEVLPMPKEECLLDIACREEYGSLKYIPSLFGNILFISIFGLSFVLQTGFGWRYRTWGFMAAMLAGNVLEIVGYYGRIMMNRDIFNGDMFIIYLVGGTIGPAFYSAAIYLSLGRVINIFGRGLCWLTPKVVTITWICFDLVSLILQSAGGALASMADTQKDSDLGVNIMIAGLAVQVLATTLFCGICLQLWFAVRKYPQGLDYSYSAFRASLKFKLFLWAIGISTIAILTRCIFRCIELLEGFHSDLANNETLFMILDGVMMIFVVVLLTVFHPGLTLGEHFHTASFSLRSSKTKAPDKVAFLQGDSSSQINLRSSTRYESLRHTPEQNA